jgi:2-keto-4-pentenoate hydratase
MATNNLNRAQTLATLLLQDGKGGYRPGPDFEQDGALSWEEAYQVQALLAEESGPIAGFKVARKPGQPNIMAPIYARNTQMSPARFQVPSSQMIGIELEIGFRVLSPLPAPDVPNYLNKLRACVAMVPAIEIVLTRLSDADACSAQLRLADNQMNGGLVVGQELHEWQSLNQPEIDVCLRFGDKVVLDGPTKIPAGDAFESFRVLSQMVGDHCGGLKPGHVVITGSLNGLPYIEPGALVSGEIKGLGEITIDFPT